MVNDFKIKKYWIITLCMILCSLSSFAQELSDTTIGFDAGQVMVSLKKHGVKDENLGNEVIKTRDQQLRQYLDMKKSEQTILRKLEAEQQKKLITNRSVAVTDIPQTEKNALLAFYNSTGGSNWTNKMGWDFSTPVTSWDPSSNTGWYGISVVNNHVNNIIMQGNNLIGTIPNEIGSLNQLIILYLVQNKLTGSIPSEIGQLTKLQNLTLVQNKLTGNIPPEIGLLKQLTTLSLGQNTLNGNIPPEIGQLNKLQIIGLDHNNLQGNIPTELFQLSSATNIELSFNSLTGFIPNNIGQLSNLTNLNLSYNQLEGNIPAEIAQLKNKLNYLSVNSNKLEGNIPSNLFELTNLFYLDLSQNKFKGTISSQIGQLTKLGVFNAPYNNLEGNLPAEIGLLTNVYQINLNINQLSGPLPSQIGMLSNLTYFTLQGNQFTGPVPSEIGQLSKLEVLILTDNLFTSIPPEINQLSKLRILELLQNKIAGEIPNLTNLASLKTFRYENNNLRFKSFINQFQTYKTNIPTYTFSPQSKINQTETISKAIGKSVDLKMFQDSDIDYLQNDTYKWFKNGVEISGAVNKVYTIPSLTLSDAGTYTCKSYHASNPDMSPLVLEREPITLKVINCTPTTGNIKLNPQEPALNQVTNFSFDTTSSGLTYSWTFYNENNTVKEVQTTAVATQTYTNRGDYKVSLVVTDMNGCTNTFEKTIKLRGECGYYQNLNGSIYSPYPYGDYFGVLLNQPVNIRYYKVNQNAILNYEWNLYNSTGFLMQSGDQESFPINITNEGEYLIKLRVSDYNNCYTTERTIRTRGTIENCVVPASDRGAAYIDGFDYRGVVINTPTPISLNYTAFSTTGFTFKWELFNPQGILVGTSNNEIYPVTLTTLGNYKINLQIKDPLGCVTDYTETLPSVELCTFNANSDDFSIFGPNDYTSGKVSFINAGESMYMRPYFWQGKPVENYTYSWKLYNPAGEEIGTGTDPYLQITLTQPGYHKITLVATNIATGCIVSRTKTMDCLIGNSCTVNNDKSAEVKNIYVNFLKKLIVRSVLGETDEQINASIALPEYMALKPYIKNGTGDKIYNFVSNYSTGHLNGFNFSFSPDREYDVHIYNRFGIYYDPEYNTIEDLNYKAESIIYTDINQYINPDDFFVSCYVQSESKRAKTSKETNKVILEPDECTTESEIRNIIFCPGEGSNCTPEIVGIIKSATPYIYPNEANAFSFETTIPNLTYTWSVTSESGEVITTSNTDITVPFVYNFVNEGIYFIKLVAKNQAGCTTNFTKKVIVDNKRCTTKANNFVFETEATNINYTWTTTDITGNTVDTVTNTTGAYSFTTSITGTYEVKLTANAGENCETVFTKTIFVENCNTIISCTQNSLLTPKVHSLFINLINKLVTTPNGTDVNRYALNEIIALASYTTSSRAKIFNFVNNSTAVSFSFSQNGAENDVFLPKSASGTILGIDLSKYFGSQGTTQVITNYSDGSNNPAGGFVRNIDFCPAVECLPSPGKIKVTHATGASKSSTSNHSKI